MADSPSLPKVATVALATVKTDPFRHWYGSRIDNDDVLLATRGQGKGLWLYDDLARDPKVGSVLDKRRLAVVGQPWALEPGKQTAEARTVMKYVQAVLDALPLETLFRDLLDATLKGVAIVEVVWKVTNDGIVPDRIVGRDPRRFTFRDTEDGEPELRLLTRDAPLDGIALPARKFIVHRFGARYGNPWGRGLGQRLFWPVFFKRQGVGFWLGAMEKFAMPTPLGRYPAGTSEDAQDKLLDALTAIAREGAVVVPEGMSIELMEAQRAGQFETYEKLARYFDEDIVITVLGATLGTMVGNSGSLALGEAHETVQRNLVKADADLLSGTLNGTLLRWITELNFPGVRPPRIWWNFAPKKDLLAQAERDVKVAEMGFRPTLKRIRDLYGEGWNAEGEQG
jgi:phage gp29-like protein